MTNVAQKSAKICTGSYVLIREIRLQITRFLQTIIRAEIGKLQKMHTGRLLK
jgi:hypothetical protein